MAGSHSLLSPSSASRWMSCPASVAVIAALGIGDKASREAAEGTVYHAISEQVLRGELKSCADAIGETREADGFKFTVNESDADYAQEYVDFIRSRLRPGVVMCVEVKLDTSNLLGVPGQGGTSDNVLLDFENRTIEVTDLKFGKGVRVDVVKYDPPPREGWTGRPLWARVSKQLGIYGTTAMLETFDLMANWQRLILRIHQPRLNHVVEVILTREEAVHFAQSALLDGQSVDGYLKAYPRGNVPVEHLSPSPEACQWCPIKGSCQGRANAMLKLFNPGIQPMTHAHAAQMPPTMTDEQLAAALELADEMRRFTYDIFAEATARAERGAKFHGWKLGDGKQGDREWPADQAHAILKKNHGDPKTGALPDPLMTTPEVKSLAQCQKALKKIPGGTETWAELEPLITRAPGKRTLLRDFDGRPGLAAAASADAFPIAPTDFQAPVNSGSDLY